MKTLSIFCFIILGQLKLNAQIFNYSSLHVFMGMDKSRFKRELTAQGVPFTSVDPPEHKSDGLTVLLNGGSMWYVYKYQQCAMMMFFLDENESGNELAENYYSYLELEGQKLNDGSWLLNDQMKKYIVSFAYDTKAKPSYRVYTIKPY